ncbi:hypothetical protein [Curtobacterium flaccumfaciens]|nr:hypothetical protein [Curtobacterium flaccumfaciens]
MKAFPSEPLADLDDVPPGEDLVVVLLEVAIALAFVGLIGLVLLWNS